MTRGSLAVVFVYSIFVNPNHFLKLKKSVSAVAAVLVLFLILFSTFKLQCLVFRLPPCKRIGMCRIYAFVSRMLIFIFMLLLISIFYVFIALYWNWGNCGNYLMPMYKWKYLMDKKDRSMTLTIDRTQINQIL